jgi:SAM-dependent methyltransferase
LKSGASVNTFYNLAYAVGFTPWERAANADTQTLPRLFAAEEADRGGPGRALDLGCGSGAHLALLAARGWKVTGVDLVRKALARAGRRLAAQGLTADLVRADATELPPAEVGSGYDLFLDIGCYHGLDPAARTRMGQAVTAAAAPDASMLVLAFRPGAFPGWAVTDLEPAATAGMPRPLRKAAPHWYRLRRD